jgi:hypothetical protein
MTAPAIGKPAMPVIGRAVAIQGHTHLYVILGEQLAQPLVQQYAVGVDPQIKLRHRIDQGPQRKQDPAQAVMPQQKRLAAMQHHVDRFELMNPGVLSDPLCGPFGCRLVQGPGLTTPALVSVRVYVAMVTGKITATAYLQDILAYRI